MVILMSLDVLWKPLNWDFILDRPSCVHKVKVFVFGIGNEVFIEYTECMFVITRNLDTTICDLVLLAEALCEDCDRI